MFKQPLNLKTSSPIRASELKDLRATITDKYLCGVPASDGKSDREGSIAVAVKLLAPEGLVSARFKAADKKNRGHIYSSEDGIPLWFELDEKDAGITLYPTIYTLWKLQVIPTLNFKTQPMENIMTRADSATPISITLPSDSNSPQTIADAKSFRGGTIISISSFPSNSKEKINVPLAVGIIVANDSLVNNVLSKERAVRVLHVWGDEICKMVPRNAKPMPPSARVPGLNQLLQELPTILKRAENANAKASIPDPSPPERAPQAVEKPERSSDESMTSEEADTILLDAALQLLHTLSKIVPTSNFDAPVESKPTLGLFETRPTLPITAAAFYSSYILPSRRCTSPSELPTYPTSDLLKTSSHKKLAKFLGSLEKMGLLTLKHTKGKTPDIFISKIKYDHEKVVGHKPFMTVGEVEEQKAKLKAKATATSVSLSDATANKPMIQARSLYKVDLSIAPLAVLFGPNYNKEPRTNGEYYTDADLLAVLEAYITFPRPRPPPRTDTTTLVQYTNPTMINLDLVLSELLLFKGDKKGVGYLKRASLLQRLKKNRGVVEWLEIKLPGKPVEIVKQTAFKPILISADKRTEDLTEGTKTATLITRFEPFCLEAEFLAEELRKRCAASTKVTALTPRGKDKTSLHEVFIQGKHLQTVTTFLLEQGVPENYIQSREPNAKAKKYKNR